MVNTPWCEDPVDPSDGIKREPIKSGKDDPNRDITFWRSFPWHKENPMTKSFEEAFQPLKKPDGDITDRCKHAAGMGIAMGIAHNIVYHAWFFADPVEITGPKSYEIVKSQWPRWFKGFGAPILWYTSTAVVFAGVEKTLEDMMNAGKTNWKTTGYAGAAAGFWIGAVTGRIDKMFSAALCTGSFMAMLQFNGMHYVSDAKQYAMTMAGKKPFRHEESDALAKLKEKYPEYADL